jgi:hypothetical protein
VSVSPLIVLPAIRLALYGRFAKPGNSQFTGFEILDESSANLKLADYFRLARDPTRKRLGERWSLKRMIEKQLDVF